MSVFDSISNGTDVADYCDLMYKFTRYLPLREAGG